MLVPHWLSLRNRTKKERQAAPEQLDLLRKNLTDAAANTTSLGTLTLPPSAVTPLVEMLDVMRTELARIDAGTSLLAQSAPPPKNSRRRSRRMTGEPAALRIARR